MIKEVALITISAVLFVQMGLSDAIGEILHLRLKIASCPKCATFWSVLAYCMWNGHGLIGSVAASFISSYAALWIVLLYDALALLYNSIYESITETHGAATDAQDGADQSAQVAADEVPQMQIDNEPLRTDKEIQQRQG